MTVITVELGFDFTKRIHTDIVTLFSLSYKTNIFEVFEVVLLAKYDKMLYNNLQGHYTMITS